MINIPVFLVNTPQDFAEFLVGVLAGSSHRESEFRQP